MQGLALECQYLKAEFLLVQLFDTEANQTACVGQGVFHMEIF